MMNYVYIFFVGPSNRVLNCTLHKTSLSYKSSGWLSFITLPLALFPQHFWLRYKCDWNLEVLRWSDRNVIHLGINPSEKIRLISAMKFYKNLNTQTLSIINQSKWLIHHKNRIYNLIAFPTKVITIFFV